MDIFVNIAGEGEKISLYSCSSFAALTGYVRKFKKKTIIPFLQIFIFFVFIFSHIYRFIYNNKLAIVIYNLKLSRRSLTATTFESYN